MTHVDEAARRFRGEAALHNVIAREHEVRAAAARRIGAARDADEAAFRARQARLRALDAARRAENVANGWRP